MSKIEVSKKTGEEGMMHHMVLSRYSGHVPATKFWTP
jgi:hypothetical protein